MQKICISVIWSAVMLLFPLYATYAQEHTANSADTHKHEYHQNHGASFLGATTPLDAEYTGFTIGTEYTRRFGPWGVGFLVEMASSRVERDIIIGVPVSLYPWRELVLFVAPAVEVASFEEVHDGESKEETELEPLLRLGTAYWFAVNETIVLAPTLQADVAKGHWSLVYGLSIGVGF